MGIACSSQDGDVPPSRPVLQLTEGRFFRYAVPDDWTTTESRTRFTATSGDGSSGAVLSILPRTPGGMELEPYLLRALELDPYYREAKVESFQELPREPALPGADWQLAKVHWTFTSGAGHSIAEATVGLIQGPAQYGAYLRVAHAPAEQWEEQRLWLPAVAESVLPLDIYSLAGEPQLRFPPPREHSWIASTYQERWLQVGYPNFATRLKQGLGRTGYIELKDPEGNEVFGLPFETFDRARGGFPHPRNQNVTLVDLGR